MAENHLENQSYASAECSMYYKTVPQLMNYEHWL